MPQAGIVCSFVSGLKPIGYLETPSASFFTFFGYRRGMMGAAWGFNAHFGFYVVLQSCPGTAVIMNVPEGALLPSTVADLVIITCC